MKWPGRNSGEVAAQPMRFIGVIIVIVVIAIAGCLLLSMLSKGRSSGHHPRYRCGGNLKQIGLSLLMYSGDNDGYFPTTVPNWGNSFGNASSEGYITSDGKVWACPYASIQRTTVANSNYIYVGSGIMDDNDHATGTVIAYDASGNHPDNNWMNALFIDGHVEGAVPDGSKGWNRN